MVATMIGEIKAKMALWKMKTKKFIGISSTNNNTSPRRDAHRKHISSEDLTKYILPVDKSNPGMHLAIKNFIGASSKENLHGSRCTLDETTDVRPERPATHMENKKMRMISFLDLNHIFCISFTSTMARKSVHGYAIASHQKRLNKLIVSNNISVSRSCSDMRQDINFDELFDKNNK